MRAVGLASVLAAALALPAVGWALALPDPDPLAIFERPETQLERDAAPRLAQMVSSTIDLGPRMIDVGEDEIGLAFRASTIPGGRSTAWDSYCLFTMDDPAVGAQSWGGGGMCVAPNIFVEQGIIMPLTIPAGGVNPPGVSGDVIPWKDQSHGTSQHLPARAS